MPFDRLCNKVRDGIYDSDKYGKVDNWSFFESEASDYDRGKERSKVVKFRKAPSENDTVGKIFKEEIKLGWMCGMYRDYLVQGHGCNYSTIVRDNRMLKRDVSSRLDTVSRVFQE